MTRFSDLLVGIAAVAVLAVGCAGRPPASAGSPPSLSTAPTSTGSTSAGPTSTSAPDLPNVHLPAGAVPVAGSKVDATALPAGYPRLVWTEDNGATVGFFAEQGACTTASASVPAQTGNSVTVRLLITKAATTKPCPLYLLDKQMTVKLDRPLGDRTVIMQAAIERG